MMGVIELNPRLLELSAEDPAEEDELDEGGEEEDGSVAEPDARCPAAFVFAEIEVVFFGAEEGVDAVVSAVVVLLRFGFGDHVCDFLVFVELAGGDAEDFGAEVAFAGGAACDDFVGACEAAVNFAGAACFESAELGEGVF